MGYADAGRLRRGAAAPPARACSALSARCSSRCRTCRRSAGVGGASSISAAPARRRRTRSRRCAAMGFAEAERIVAAVRSVAGRAGARAALAARARPAGADAAGAAGRAGAPARSRTPPSPASTPSSAACRPGCSCCRCSSATRRCSSASPRCSARRPRSPTIWRAIPRRWRAAVGATDDADPARAAARAGCATRALLEDAIGIIRAHACARQEFAISVATMEGRIDADAAGEARRTALADAAMAALLRRGGGGLRRPLRPGARRRHGRWWRWARPGAREMMAGSDLDLMLIYDHPEGVTESRGARPAAGQPVVHPRGARLRRGADRAGRRRAALCGRHAAAAVGQQGPGGGLAAGLRAATTPEEAWTWERMALTRARVVAGPPRLLRRQSRRAIRAALPSAGPAARIRADAAAMRAPHRARSAAGGPWDVKLRPGGQIEVEFIAQALQLVHGAGHPPAASPTTRARACASRGGRPAGGGGCRAADPGRPGLAHRAGHAAHHLGRGAGRPSCPRPGRGRLLRAVAASGVEPTRLTCRRCSATLDALARGCPRGVRSAGGRSKHECRA